MDQRKDEIQNEALAALRDYDRGTAVLPTGGGKTMLGIKYILERLDDIETILITYPRNIIETTAWVREFRNQGFTLVQKPHAITTIDDTPLQARLYTVSNRKLLGRKKLQVLFTSNNSAYRIRPTFMHADLLICDEIHTLATEVFGRILVKGKFKYVLGLTGTPDDKKWDKRMFYQRYCPIRYTNSSGNDGELTNKRKYVIYNHFLTDNPRIKVDLAELFPTGFPISRIITTEKQTYSRICNLLAEAEEQLRKEMEQEGIESSLWSTASWWYWRKRYKTKHQYLIAKKYLDIIMTRRKFLLSLQSHVNLTQDIKKLILQHNPSNKVLIFSEFTAQISKISKHVIHSKTHKSKKQYDAYRDQLIEKFDTGVIRELGSCQSLGLGTNLKGANFAILESYSSSEVSNAQKMGRTDRLPVDTTATIIIIVTRDTQQEAWAKNLLSLLDVTQYDEVSSITELQKLL